MNTTQQENIFSLTIVLQIIIILLLLIGGGALYASITKLKTTCNSEMRVQSVPENIFEYGFVSSTDIFLNTTTTTTTTTTVYPFDYTGVLIANSVQGNPTDTWYFIYDTQSVFAQTTRVIITKQSVCVDAEHEVIACGVGVQMRNGIRVRIQGEIQDGSIVAHTIFVLTK